MPQIYVNSVDEPFPPEALQIFDEESSDSGQLGGVVARDLSDVGHLVQRRHASVEIGIRGQQQREQTYQLPNV